MPIFPDQLFIKLPYRNASGLTSTGGIKFTVYSLNSIWDPDVTTTGTTVLGLAEWQLIYSKYQVFGCKIRISFWNKEGAADDTNIVVGYRLHSHTQNPGTPTTELYRIDPHYKCKVLGSTLQGGQPTRTVFTTGYISCAKVENIAKATYNAQIDAYAANINSGPLYQPHIELFVDDLVLGPGAGTPSTNYEISIIYFAKLYDKYQIAE